MSKSFLSLEEEEDMVTSFKKSKNISIQSAKMIEEVEDETKRQLEQDDNFIKYNAEQLRISPQENQSGVWPQHTHDEEEAPQVVIDPEDGLEEDSGPRRQFKNESKFFIIFFIVSLFLYGLAKSLRAERAL